MESPPSLSGAAAFWRVNFNQHILRVNFNQHILEVKMRTRLRGGDNGGGRGGDGNGAEDGAGDQWRYGWRCGEKRVRICQRDTKGDRDHRQ